MQFKDWYDTNTFVNRGMNLLVTLLIIYIIYALSPLFLSIGQFAALSLYPFCIAFILYYLLRPPVRLLEKKLPAWLSIVIAYLALVGFITFVIIYFYPTAISQVDLFLKFKDTILNNDKITNLLEGYFSSITSAIFSNITNVLQVATDFVVVFVIVPFVVFYLLRDDKAMYQTTLNYLKKRKIVDDPPYFLYELDSNLTNFISARVLISLIVSILILICFLVIGIEYPIVLFLSSFLFYIIPTIGFIIAAIPPLIVGFSTSNLMGLEVVMIMAIATMIEGSLLSPKILGDALYVHPITMIFVLWVAGLLFGILGLIFATPLYVILKVTLKHLQLLPKW